RRLSVPDLPRANDPAAVRFSDRLVAQAHAERRNRRAPALDRRHRDPGLRGRARPRRDDDGAWRQRADLLDANLIVTAHDRIGAKPAQILDQLERERIVVVDDEYHARG